MIPLTRIRTNPPVHANFFGQKRLARNLKLLKEKRDGKLEAEGEKKWDSTFWKESKDQLLTESNNKCAYCETPTKVVAYGDVEHFRPKSKYWWLAYSYENYLPSCSICNQKYKKDFFRIADPTLQMKGPEILPTMKDAELKTLAPTITVDPLDNSKGMPLQDFVNEHKAEKPLIINPYYEDPSIYLAYKPVLLNKEVVVVPTEPKYKPVVEACEDLYGVNRQELMDFRFQWYAYYMTCRHTLNDPNIGANTMLMNQNRLKDLRSDVSAYAGMVRYFDNIALEDLPWDFNITIGP